MVGGCFVLKSLKEDPTKGRRRGKKAHAVLSAPRDEDDAHHDLVFSEEVESEDDGVDERNSEIAQVGQN